ncbi:Terpene cyclase/mutase family member [Forsythia ovata]|uniref:Terpene cyclase/mutase family member n=1 Tax=Forsythia ovata TaxID=205694 RepID=A0ABD1SLQ2_9LAMI
MVCVLRDQTFPYQAVDKDLGYSSYEQKAFPPQVCIQNPATSLMHAEFDQSHPQVLAIQHDDRRLTIKARAIQFCDHVAPHNFGIQMHILHLETALLFVQDNKHRRLLREMNLFTAQQKKSWMGKVSKTHSIGSHSNFSGNLFTAQQKKSWMGKIENEYGPQAKVLGAPGHQYMTWAANMPVGLDTRVPWVMCKEKMPQILWEKAEFWLLPKLSPIHPGGSLIPLLRICWDFSIILPEPLLTRWPFSKLREKALKVAMEHVQYEDMNSRYLCIGGVEKVLCLIACWVEDPNSEANERHLARIPDYFWVAEDGLKMQSFGCQIWDAAFSIQATLSSNLAEEYGMTLIKAHDFVKASQCFERVRKWPITARIYSHIGAHHLKLDPRKIKLRPLDQGPCSCILTVNYLAIQFTCNRVVSEGKTPVKIVLYDSISKKIMTSEPLSSIKVTIVVLDSDFSSNDREDWTEEEFDGRIVRNREGRRLLVTGDLILSLHEGVGYIGEVSFTDNSSWIRRGRFFLGAKVHTSSIEVRIKERISKAFKVKDHRG